MAPPLIVLIAASPTYPPKATAVAALPPGRAMNNAITTVIVTANARPITAFNAGPRNGLPVRTLCVSQAPARNTRSIPAMTNQYPPQAEKVTPPSASRYQGRNMATGSRNVPAPTRTPARLRRLDRVGLTAGAPALCFGVRRRLVCIAMAPLVDSATGFRLRHHVAQR